MIKRTRCMSQYTVDIDLIKVMELDSELENEGDYDNHLYHLINRVRGVINVDYNGHFGPVIFIDIETEYDDENTWSGIEMVIDAYLSGRRD